MEKLSIIVRALYSGTSSGANYWGHILSAIEEMGLSSWDADPDIWLRPTLKSNGVEQC